jgi:hypothetical protein
MRRIQMFGRCHDFLSINAPFLGSTGLVTGLRNSASKTAGISEFHDLKFTGRTCGIVPTDWNRAYLELNYNHTFSFDAQPEFTDSMDLMAGCFQSIFVPTIDRRQRLAMPIMLNERVCPVYACSFRSLIRLRCFSALPDKVSRLRPLRVCWLALFLPEQFRTQMLEQNLDNPFSGFTVP